MSIFNKIIPWFIPSENFKRKIYQAEVRFRDKELAGLYNEFQELSKEYNHKIAFFEERIGDTRDPELYELYQDVKLLAYKTSILWDRIGAKNDRQIDLMKFDQLMKKEYEKI